MADVISFIVTNYLLILSIYIAGGVVYAFIKWVLMLLKLRRAVSDIGEVEIANYKNLYDLKATDSKVLQTLRNQKTVGIFGSGVSYPPTAKNNKGNLLFWAAFWPFNAIYTAFADVAVEIWNWVYNRFGSMLNAVATKILPN